MSSGYPDTNEDIYTFDENEEAWIKGCSREFMLKASIETAIARRKINRAALGALTISYLIYLLFSYSLRVF